MRQIKTQGFYYFEDGSKIWFFELPGREKAAQIRKHGKIIMFEHTKV